MSFRVYPDRIVVAAEGLILCEHAASWIVRMIGQDRRSMTGSAIWLSFSANQAPFATEHLLPNFPMHSARCSNIY